MNRLHLRVASAAIALPVLLSPAIATAATGDRSGTAATARHASGPATVPDAEGARRGFADTTWGPTRWQGNRLRHPRSGRFYPDVIRWANLVSAIMREKHIPKRYLRGILAQIQQESSGNQYSVNHWDSNAAAGMPSKGLLQIIAPTYRAYAKPGYRNLRYQMVPYTNIWASLEYVINSYGMHKFALWNRGYNQGY